MNRYSYANKKTFTYWKIDSEEENVDGKGLILVLRHKLPRKGLGRLPPLEGLGFGSGGPLLQVDAFPNLVPGQGSNPRAYSDLVLRLITNRARKGPYSPQCCLHHVDYINNPPHPQPSFGGVNTGRGYWWGGHSDVAYNDVSNIVRIRAL